jgi:hypothetical protein
MGFSQSGAEYATRAAAMPRSVGPVDACAFRVCSPLMLGLSSRGRGVGGAVALAILLAAWLSGCGPLESESGRTTPRIENWLTARHAAPIPCTTRLDSTGGGPLALGLFLRCEIPPDSAGTLMGRATLWQRGGDVLVATSNAHGSDRTSRALRGGTPVRVEDTGAAPMALEFWLPGSEIHREGHSGPATVLIEIWREEAPQGPARYFACELPKLEPARFVRRLPGSDGP